MKTSAPSAVTTPAVAGGRAVLATAALGTMLMPLNSTMIAVALPDIVADLDVSVGASAWLISGYLIAQASLQPLAGKLGDRYGRRPLLLAGLASFAVVSLGAALAPTLDVLMACRILQAVTGAMVFPNALALVRELLPEQRRGRAFGLLGSAIGLAAAAGPPVGGVLVEAGGWRAIFLVNLPWVAVALWLALRTVPAGVVRAARARFDFAGAVSLSLLLAAAAWLIHPSGPPLWALPAGVAIVAILSAWFVRFELRREDPVLEPRLLRVRPFAAATASIGFSNLALYGTLLAVPVLLASRPGWSGAEIGLSLAAMSVPMVALSPIGGRLSDRAGRRSAAASGLALLAVALVALGIAGHDVSAGLLIASLALVGAGIGLSNAAVQAAGVEALDARDAGVASGIFSTGRYIGGIAAASLVAALANGDGGGFALLFSIEAAAALVSMILALALPGRERRGAIAASAASGFPAHVDPPRARSTSRVR